MHLGYANVDQMLANMTQEQFLEWKAFDEVDPFGEDRNDYRSAQVVQALWNIARDTKRYPEGFPLRDFVLLFGDTPPPPRPEQSTSYQEMVIEAWVQTNNAIHAAKGA